MFCVSTDHVVIPCFASTKYKHPRYAFKRKTKSVITTKMLIVVNIIIETPIDIIHNLYTLHAHTDMTCHVSEY